MLDALYLFQVKTAELVNSLQKPLFASADPLPALRQLEGGRKIPPIKQPGDFPLKSPALCFWGLNPSQNRPIAIKFPDFAAKSALYENTTC